ncbi:tetratricopeptide repeat protein [Candidatus Latescibacterota bacterium]
MKHYGKYLSAVLLLMVLLFPVLYASAQTDREEKIKEAKKHFSFAVQYKNAKKYDEASEQYIKSIALYDSIFNVHYSYGDLLIMMEKKKEARREFVKSLMLNPEHYNSALQLSRLYYENGNFDSTMVMYELMYKLEPENNKLLATIAGLKEYLGDIEGALNDFIKLIDAGEDSYDNLMRASSLAQKQDKMSTALKYATMALEKKPGDSEALKIASHTSESLEQLDTAALFYRQRAEKDSTTESTFVQLEDIYRKLFDRKNLLWALERHHKIAPEDMDILGELCELLYAESMMDKCVQYVKKGLILDPGDGRFRILFGENFRAQGQNDKALEQYKLALKDEKWNSSAQRLINLIEKPETEEEKVERDFFNRGKKEIR